MGENSKEVEVKKGLATNVADITFVLVPRVANRGNH